YDVVQKRVVDSLKWRWKDWTSEATKAERPRALAFSPDGNTAYIGSFGIGTTDLVQRLTAPSLIPTPFLPSDKAVDVLCSPIIKWNGSYMARSYALQVSKNDTFSELVYNQNGITSNSQQISGLDYQTQYFWRISANDTPDWSPVWSFTTVIPPPGIPTLSSPGNGVSEVSLSPILFWNVNPDATNYSLQVSSDSLFNNIIFEKEGLSNTNQQINGLINNKIYFWRVSASKSNSPSDWSAPWSFKTIGTIPQPPTLNIPVNNEINISTAPTFTWSKSENAQSYSIQISKNTLFTEIIFNKSGIIDTSIDIIGLNNSTQYYWRVNASNNYGTSNWSTVRNLTTIITFPPMPSLAYPSNGQINTSKSIVLYWNLNSYATSYSIQVSTQSDFSNFVINQSGIVNTNYTVSALENNSRYFWRVIAINNYGNSLPSSTWSFTTGPKSETAWTNTVTLTDNGSKKAEVVFGLHPQATDNIDAALGEIDLPPLPPAGIIDARFILPNNVSSTAKDYRASTQTQVEWLLSFQPNSGGYPITFSWDKTQLPKGTFILKDQITGTIVSINMKGTNSYTLTNSAITRLVIKYLETVSKDIQLNTGWNMVSVPVKLNDMKPLPIFPNKQSLLFGFNDGYKVDTAFVNGKGYWLKNSKSEVVP
ncbi:MAG: fibronectin type III, partial [Ignavibacteria bacterium]